MYTMFSLRTHIGVKATLVKPLLLVVSTTISTLRDTSTDNPGSLEYFHSAV